MKKIWYIKIDNQIEGPFSLPELKLDTRITPDTLVFKEGFDQWIAIRHVPELKEVFVDEEKPSALEEESEEGVIVPQDEMVLHLQNNYSPFLFLVIVLILVIYIFYNLQLWR